MKRSKKKNGYFLVFLLLIFWFICVIRINLKYPDPKIQKHELNEVAELDGFEVSVSKMEFLDEGSTKELFADEIERYGDCRCILVYITVKNNRSEKARIELYPFVLESDAWKNSVIMSAFLKVNEEYVTEGRATLQPEIEAGGTYECILTYSIAKVSFTENQWKGLKNRNYNLVLSLYPVKKSIQLQ